MARWRRVSDRERSELTEEGTFMKVRDVTFELLDSGTRGTVTIPLRSYTAEFVAAEIDAYAQRIEAVHRLEG